MKLSERQLLALLKSIQPQKWAEHGMMVGFADIMDACKLQGMDNHEIVKALIRRLHDEGHLEAISDDYGMHGVKFSD